MRPVAASPEIIFGLLSDAQNLTFLLPNVRRVEVLEEGAESARIRTHMSIGPVNGIQSEGVVRWSAEREIVFTSSQPVLVEARWSLTPAGGATHVQIALSVDLTPMMGPLAAFVPQESVSALIAPDLETTLARVAQLVERNR
jgi:carbon monoxide dehydrogenase subunit G